MAGWTMAGRCLMLVAAGGLLIYGGWSFWTEMSRAAESLATFRWAVLAPVLILSMVNYLLRAVRWEYYLRLLSVRLPFLKSAAVFFASLLFCITPGRLGEVCKSYFVNKVNGTPVARTVPIVLAERLVDLLATGLLALVGLLNFKLGWEIVGVAVALGLGVLFIFGSRGLAHAVLNRLAKLPRIGKAAPHLLTMFEGG